MELKRWHLVVVYTATQDSMHDTNKKIHLYSNKVFISLVRIGIFEQNTPSIFGSLLWAATTLTKTFPGGNTGLITKSKTNLLKLIVEEFINN